MSESQHWYDRDGAPAYEVRAANGNMRPTTLRDARKLGLVPSVTTVLSVKAKPALETWKVRQGILAALTLAREPGEPDSSYLDRVLSDSRQQAIDAANEGTRIHDAIERAYKGQFVPHDYRPHVEAAKDEVTRLFPDVSDWIAEASFAHEYGYGGKVDLHSPSTGIVVDFKGKEGDFSDGKKLAYDQNEQLGGYQIGLCLPNAEGANVFVSRTHPGKAMGHKWAADDMRHGGQVFLDCLQLWKRIKQYNAGWQEGSAAA